MDSNTYDAIIIGAGGNGMCMASYLARSGMKVGIFESRYEEGGGFWTWENLPGFRFNHAHCHEFNEWMPFLHDFGLYDLGFRDVYPEVQNAIVWEDGAPPIVLYQATDAFYDKTYKSIAYYSKHDAETYVRCRKLARQLEPVLTSWFYNPPVMPTAEVPNPLIPMGEQMMQAFGLPKHYLYSSAQDVIDYLFESPQMRTMFYKFAEEWATPLRVHGLGMVSLMSTLFLTSNNRVAVGGTHTLAHAMAMAAIREGVDIHERCHVREILVENGVSTGIQLDDGREFKANKMVISNADVKQTLLGMLGGEKNLSDHWVKQAEHFKYGHGMVINLAHMGLHEAPDYKSAKWNEDANAAFVTYCGAESPADMVKHSLEVEMGLEPSLQGRIPIFGSVPSLFAPGYAPKGKHSFYCAWFAPNASSYTEAEWREISDNLIERVIKQTLGDYAPNMTMDNVIGGHPVTPYTLQKENLMPEGDFCLGSMRLDQLAHCRPFPEAARYKTEVENVYMCSSGQHPFGGLSTGVGYAAYKQVAEDFDLSYKPWENNPRGY